MTSRHMESPAPLAGGDRASNVVIGDFTNRDHKPKVDFEQLPPELRREFERAWARFWWACRRIGITLPPASNLNLLVGLPGL